MSFKESLGVRGARIWQWTLISSVCVALSACLDITGSDGAPDASSMPDANTPVGDANVPVGDGDAATEDAATQRQDAATQGQDAATEDAAIDEPDAGMAMITGAAEKGPFVLGSSVTISVVDNDGDPTGEVFNTQTTDDLGHFEVEVQHPGPVELAVTGYYYNEATGALSVAPLTLRGWYRVLPSGVQTANLNVITHLTNRRVRALFADGMSLDAAIAQAEAELVAALDIGVPESLGGTSLDISSSGYLLAVSAVLAEAGRARGGNGGADAALQELLNGIADDLTEDGAIAPALHDEIVEVQATVDIEEVTERLAERYEELGNPITVPDLNEQLDSDLDGVINSDDNCPNVANADQADGNSDGVGDACCGDGTIEGDEACDDGASNADDAACTAICAAAYCGDTLTWAGNETCDDGNTVSGDGCDANCRVTGCGNGVTTGSEECDDGNTVSGDGCDVNCTVSACGNGITAGSEECDDANDVSGDGCSADCEQTLVLGALSPDAVLAGSQDLVLELTGTGFAQPAQAMFGDTPIDTTLHDSTLAVALVPAWLMTEVGVVPVTMQSDGWISNAVPFTLTDPFASTSLITGSLSSGCRGCTADLLATGQVLVVAGAGVSGPRATASVYTPRTGLFTDTEPLDTARSDHRSVRLDDGRVLVAGGFADLDGNVTNSVEAYDPATGLWTSLTPMNVGRAGHAMALLADGRVFVCGGIVGGANKTKSTEIYDPSNDTWSDSSGDMAQERTTHTATLLLNGKVLIVGGSFQTELYDPASGWEPAPGLGNRSGHIAVLLPNGAVLVAGGGDIPELYTGSVDDTWPAGTAIQERAGASAVLLNSGKVLVAGGMAPGSNTPLATAELYDPEAPGGGSWTQVRHLRQGRSDFPLTVLPSGKVLAVGGFGGGNPALPSAELWDPGDGSCGDGAVRGTESCDVGPSNDDRFACTESCEAARCGDALIWMGHEVCDDGNTVNGDGCDTNCTPSACGNGVQAVDEACDDSNEVDGDGCDSNCTVTSCGNGVRTGDEVCDDGNDDPGDGCDPPCGIVATLRTVSPDTAVVGSPDLTVSITGTLFLEGAQVMFGDGALVTTVTSDTTVTALIPASFMAESGSTAVTLLNPGGAFTNALPFDVYAPEPTVSNWSFAGSLSSGRVGCTANLLANGQVLIAGGSGSGGGVLAAAILYDPASGLFSETGSLTFARTDHASVILQNGRLLVAGGSSSSGSLDRVEMYNPSTGAWTNVARMKSGRAAPRMVALANGTLLVSGGLRQSGVVEETAEIYDLTSNTWTLVDPMSTPRLQHSASLLASGKVLVVGGSNNGVYSATSELYDPATGEWTSTGSLHQSRAGHAAVVLSNGKVLVAGGTSPGGAVRSSELYDPATGLWTVVQGMAHSRVAHQAVLLASGEVLVAGGVPASGGAIASAELFDPATATWSFVSPMQQARRGITLTVLASGKVLAVTGYGASGYPLTAELWDPANP